MRRQFSLRTRLLVVVGAIALLALTIADAAVYTSLNSFLYTQTDSTLQLAHYPVEVAANTLNGHGPAQQPPDSEGSIDLADFCAVGRQSAPGMFIEVRTTKGNVIKRETCPAFIPGQRSYSPILPTVITGFQVTAENAKEPVTYFTVASASPVGPTFRVRASILTGGGILIVADPVGSIRTTLHHLLLIELTVTASALLGSILLGLVLVRGGLRPLRDVVSTADSISSGDLTHRVPHANANTEVGHVATALNVMLERIQSSFEELQNSENRLRRFVSDASHELRTPIAAISAYSQLFSHGASDHVEDLERLMGGIEREAGRMTYLVEDLLLLARFDEHMNLDVEPTELTGLAVEAIETARMLGPEWPLYLESAGPVEVMGDGNALRRVINNLLTNVRVHTPPGTAATVSVRELDGMAVLDVADEGPGLSEVAASRVFERFFRADSSRTRETGGTGLGLSIVATIVHAHGGQVSIHDRPGGGALFRVTLPLLASEDTGNE